MNGQKTLSVLILEDDSTDAAIVTRLLARSCGQYRVHAVRSLAEAKQTIGECHYDVVISDLNLPDSVGLETVHCVRQVIPTAAIIVLSGSSDESNYVSALRAGADGFICKHDVDQRLLHRCIEQSMHRIQQQLKILELVREVDKQQSELARHAKELENKNASLRRLCESSQSFVNHVSHEFRTPLCVVKQYANLMADGSAGAVTEQQEYFLRVIEDRIDGLNNIVDDMLDVSRHEAGLLGASRKCCVIADVFDREIPLLRQRANLRKIEIVCDDYHGLPEIFCDQEKLGRSLTNLVTNAIKFSKAGSQIVVSVACCLIEQELRVSVRDFGAGIDPEECEKIFNRFRQATTSIQSGEKGFGLGLSITRELVELNLGDLSLTSVVGEGSTFSFSVPLNDIRSLVTRYLDRLLRLQTSYDKVVTVFEIAASNALTPQSLSDAQALLNFVLHARDLLVPVGSGRWILVLNTHAEGAREFCARLAKQTEETNRNRPVGKLPGFQLENRGTYDVDVLREDVQLCMPSSRDVSPRNHSEILINV
ncbi:hybrid sensor histidine kinase/response regulator [Rhodopirellula sp. SWK7]|uniref:ATP-binding response regulator n=1 Tax=Rhodopirellula sp. SWK7 TaxID=595460 RepID=UPI0002BF2714|nr:hybrid sensor histidine kinase/response regulator [Rhodopirellula sp. SWK7]EMI41379.1 response regulator receiver sensor signal transduction histidine kinase [Rhodopirellula sp. SWK7]